MRVFLTGLFMALLLANTGRAAESSGEDAAQSALPKFEAVRKPPNARVVRDSPLPRSRTWETTEFPARLIYLNGVNVSSLRNQELEAVDVRVDEAGNIHITAPQYDVSVDASYHPLLPGELPRFPKGATAPEGLPKGRYSKESGARSVLVPPPAEGGASAEGNTLRGAESEVPKSVEKPKENREKSPDKDGGKTDSQRRETPPPPPPPAIDRAQGSEAPQPAQSLDAVRPAPVVPAIPPPEGGDLQGGASL